MKRSGTMHAMMMFVLLYDHIYTKFPANDFVFIDDTCIEARYFVCEKIYSSLGLMVLLFPPLLHI